jgi:hypothetical protein
LKRDPCVKAVLQVTETTYSLLAKTWSHNCDIFRTSWGKKTTNSLQFHYSYRSTIRVQTQEAAAAATAAGTLIKSLSLLSTLKLSTPHTPSHDQQH